MSSHDPSAGSTSVLRFSIRPKFHVDLEDVVAQHPWFMRANGWVAERKAVWWLSARRFGYAPRADYQSPVSTLATKA